MPNYTLLTMLLCFSFFGIGVLTPHAAFAKENGTEASQETDARILPLPFISLASHKTPIVPAKKPKYVRGIHITPWLAGSRKGRARINKLLDETELNTLVIAIKEVKGEVYIPGVKEAADFSTFVPAIPNIEEYLINLKQRNIYTIARVVVFKDDLLSRIRQDYAVKNTSGTIWQDRAGMGWLNPYNKKTWEYTFSIARRAVELGFDEIQFDYIRFPSDGNIRNCRYRQSHSSQTAVAVLVEFLQEARKQLKPLGANVSVDVFGLTTTNTDDLGIGQNIVRMTAEVDFVSPMVYPSHYRNGAYNLPNPNKEPYKTVFLGLKGGKNRLGNDYIKLRPFLQDFSLGHRYDAKEVREQIQACYDNDIPEWILWDPTCQYTRTALLGPEAADTYEKSPTSQMQTEKNTLSLSSPSIITTPLLFNTTSRVNK